MSVKEFSFFLYPKMSDASVKRALKARSDEYEKLVKSPRVKTIKAALPDVEVLHASTVVGNNVYLVFYKKQCKVEVSFETLNNNDSKKMLKLFGRKGIVPHAMTHSDFRGLGYVSFFYKLVLKKYVLVTDSHTKSAIALWDNLSKKPGIQSYWIDPYQMRVLTKPTRDALRVLSTVPLKA